MKRLVIHIGTGKTGTSSIQNFLHANRAILANEFGADYSEIGLAKINHFGEEIHAHYTFVEWVIGRKTQELEKLAQALAESSCVTGILSCENLYHHLSAQDISFLARWFKPFSVEIICYVRRQDLYMESAWKQQVKIGALNTAFHDYLKHHTETEFLETVHGNYYKKLLPWAEHFGKAAIKLRVFDKSEWVNGNLIDDFLDACGIEADKSHMLSRDLPIANTAMPSELIMLVRKVNAMHSIPKADQHKFVMFLNRLNIFREKPLLSSLDRLAILTCYRNVNIALFNEFGAGQVPDCFNERAIGESSHETNSQDISVEDLAVRTIAAIWKQSAPDTGLIIKSSLSDLKENGSELLKGLFIRLFKLRNIINAKGYRPKELKPELPPNKSPFILQTKKTNLELDKLPGFKFYGFTKLPALQTPLLSDFPRVSMTVGDCFISAAKRGSLPGNPKALLGGLYENGRLIKAASYRGPGVLKPADPAEVDQTRINKSRFIAGTGVYMGWLLHTFGHLLLEMPARFWFMESVDAAACRFIFHPLNYRRGMTGEISVDTVLKDSFTRTLLDCYGISKDRIVLADQDLCVEKLLIPSPLFFINQTIDPSQKSVYERIGSFAQQQSSGRSNSLKPSAGEVRKKIYVSRRLLARAGQNRKAKNESLIEQLFESYGFEIVFPEQLSFHDQVRLLRDTEILAGCEGSALHMGIFLPPKSKMIALSARGVGTNQLAINALKSIETHYIHAGMDRSVQYSTGNWEADIEYLRNCLSEILN